ncbi:DUF2752 domain-containing protein [Haloferula sargassicola]|uniref:DUF2752 domain-containing protein n=1 Tax=Haloferula sargassicola TaxID=490096 RepID=A0ABP9USC3_9BACT
MKPWRLAILLAGCAVAGVGAWWLATRGVAASPLMCGLNRWTGLHCPGCGMTRAAYSLLHGHPWQAFRFNPLGMVVLPLLGLMALPEIIGWVKNEPPKRWVRLNHRWAMVLVVAVIAFGILRNLPWAPFHWLAPTSLAK